MPHVRRHLALRHATEGKTLRTLTVGALWEPEGNKLGRIHLDAIPVGFSGRLVFWPADDEKDPG